MEKNQKSHTELNNTQKKEESNKLEEQKKSSTNKESSNINSINFFQKNDTLYRGKNNNNNLFPNNQSLYPLLFT